MLTEILTFLLFVTAIAKVVAEWRAKKEAGTLNIEETADENIYASSKVKNDSKKLKNIWTSYFRFRMKMHRRIGVATKKWRRKLRDS